MENMTKGILPTSVLEPGEDGEKRFASGEYREMTQKLHIVTIKVNGEEVIASLGCVAYHVGSINEAYEDFTPVKYAANITVLCTDFAYLTLAQKYGFENRILQSIEADVARHKYIDELFYAEYGSVARKFGQLEL